MRALFFLMIIFVLPCISSYSQETNNPSCYSNASVLTIEKITVTDYSTIVNLKFYTTNENYSFYISSGMYIQEYGNSYSTKYYIKEFVGNELDKIYTNNAYQTYNFTWIFEKVPAGLSNINIIEPLAPNYVGWYWKNIVINNPLSSSMSNFFKNSGVATIAELAHPTNTYKSGYYNVYSNKIWVKIYYDGYTTELEITRDGNFFTNIYVISDDDFITPFTGIELIKDVALDIIKDNSDENNKSAFQKKINKTISEMNGKELACLILTLNWLDY